MSAEIQAALLERLPDVDDAFLEEHREALLGFAGELPGVDSVRAAVVRMLPRLVDDPLELEGHLQRAAQALRAYPDAVAAGDPVALMARHPAWVGLAHLEVAEALGGNLADALEVAIQHARLGFSAASGGAVQDGEVLWAMAEIAEETGWDDRATHLIARAVDAPFADESSKAQVQLLAGQHLAGTDSGRATALLADVVEADVAHPLRVQAAFVLAHLAEHGDDTDAALGWLRRALALVEPDDDPAVGTRLRAELERLSR